MNNYYHFKNSPIFKKKTNHLASPGLEPETFSVLDWRDNQLHHETFDGLNFLYLRNILFNVGLGSAH